MNLLRFRLAALMLLTLFTPALVRAQGVSEGLKPFVEKEQLAGAVLLVADREKILALEAIGYANREDKTLLTNDSIFWIASQSKPITAALLMILVDEGKLKLDDPVEMYLPEFKNITFEGKSPKTKITVRQILSHTSGMPFKSTAENPTLDGLTLKDAVTSYAKTPLVSEPGTKYLYSNSGINTAGRLIEVLSGMPYEKFLEERFTKPMEMKDTTFWPNEEQTKRIAKVYRPGKDKTGLEATTIGQLKYPLSDKARQPMPAGGLFATATDVAHFCQMVLNKGTYKGKRILSEAAVAEMTKRQTPDGLTAYGLGWSTGGNSFGHGGALSTNMTIDPSRNLITVFLVQHAGFPGDGGRSQGIFRKAAEEKFASK